MTDPIEYDALNQPVLAAIPTTARRILDVGCGTGALGQAVKARQQGEIVGITHSAVEAEMARRHLDWVVIQDLNAFDPTELGVFDCVVCSHVLEHLHWPGEFLRAARPLVDPGGRLIVALPNVLAWRQRIRFLRGEFRYTEGGLMDRTHFRFFDWSTARELVAESGYRTLAVRADGVFPGARWLPWIGGWLSGLAVRSVPGIFAWQFIFEAEPSDG
jgi:SAM-dependent methyltransferase